MNRACKLARFTVIVISTSCVLSGGAFLILYFTLGLPKASAGLAFMSLIFLLGFTPLMYRKDQGKVVCDERDIEINGKAVAAGFVTAYLVMGLACMLSFFVLGPKGTLSVQWLPMIFMGGGLSHGLVHSIVILVEYGRGTADD
jgi:hypothetical protein